MAGGFNPGRPVKKWGAGGLQDGLAGELYTVKGVHICGP